MTNSDVESESPHRHPVVDLLLATRGRNDEPDAFLRCLETQTSREFRLIVVDQNVDDRLVPVIGGYPGLNILHVRDRGGVGLSRARNIGLRHLQATIVAFPDDDCVYGRELVADVTAYFAHNPDKDGLLGRVRDPSGDPGRMRWGSEPGTLDRDTIWNRVSAAAIFLRSSVTDRVGAFDEDLGLGAPTRWASGEEVDYIIRALDAGFVLEFDPRIAISHHDPFADLTRAAKQRAVVQGSTSIRLMRKHGYPRSAIARSIVRSAGGAAARFLQGRVTDAQFHAAVLRGRLSELARTSSRTRQ